MKKGFKSILLIVAVLVVVAGGYLVYRMYGSRGNENFTSINLMNLRGMADYKKYLSQELKISFQYPNDWFVDERFGSILVASYDVKFEALEKQPKEGHIVIFIDEYDLCYPTIEENLIDNSCGELGLESRRTIVSKEKREQKGGTLFTYIVRPPGTVGNSDITYYLLQSGERILSISPQPEILQYKREFDEIVNSIEFLN